MRFCVVRNREEGGGGGWGVVERGEVLCCEEKGRV